MVENHQFVQQVIPYLSGKSPAGNLNRSDLIDLLNQFGVSKVSLVPADLQGAFMAAVQAASEAKAAK